MLFEPRTYRNTLPDERFKGVEIRVAELNLWLAVDVASFNDNMKPEAERTMAEFIGQLASYMAEDCFFKKSLKPYEVPASAPAIIRQMADGAALGGVGPMAVVCAAAIQLVAKNVADNFGPIELFIECGGELYLKLNEPLMLRIFAGDSDISGLAGFAIKPEQTPLAVGTGLMSRGTPINHTQAEGIMILGADSCQATGLAVGLGNKVKVENDVERALKRTEVIPEVQGALIILGDQIGLRGEFDIEMIH